MILFLRIHIGVSGISIKLSYVMEISSYRFIFMLHQEQIIR